MDLKLVSVSEIGDQLTRLQHQCGIPDEFRLLPGLVKGSASLIVFSASKKAARSLYRQLSFLVEKLQPLVSILETRIQFNKIETIAFAPISLLPSEYYQEFTLNADELYGIFPLNLTLSTTTMNEIFPKPITDRYVSSIPVATFSEIQAQVFSADFSASVVALSDGARLLTNDKVIQSSGLSLNQLLRFGGKNNDFFPEEELKKLNQAAVEGNGNWSPCEYFARRISDGQMCFRKVEVRAVLFENEIWRVVRNLCVPVPCIS